MKSILSKLNVTSRMVIPFTVCILVVMATSIIYSFVYLSEAYMVSIRKDAVTKARLAANEIDKLTLEVSSAVNVMAEAVKMIDLRQDSVIHHLISQTMNVSSNIFGSTFALHPGAGYGKRSPYVYRIQPTVFDASDLADSYDYEHELWYTQPVEAQQSTWSDPYFDEGGGNALMVTYSVPVYNDSRQLLGVMTGDIALEWLNGYIAKEEERLFAFIIDRSSGMYIAHPNKDYILNEHISNVSNSTGNHQMTLIGNEMMSGLNGFGEYTNEIDAKESFVAYYPTTVANWSIAVVMDKAVVLNAVNHLRIMQTVIMSGGFLLFILLIIFVAHSIKQQLGIEPVELSKRLEKLAKGEIEKSHHAGEQYGSDSVAAYVDTLSDNLASTATFAQAIGRGDFQMEYKTLSSGDVLGNALLEMSDNLQKSKKEAEANREEERKRNWATSGLAKFAEILRSNNDNLETLSYNIISNLVKYLDANQGGVFVLNEAENEEEMILELKACYAYDRKKFLTKQIRPGEGLIGTCYLEGELIYMTDVPKEYVTITSGLGDAAPTAILICPLKVNDRIFGVIELASFCEFEPYQLEFVQKVGESIASSISTVRVNIRTERLLAQTRLQTEEKSNTEEELRQNMEEMRATQEELSRRESELQVILENKSEYSRNEAEKLVENISKLAAGDIHCNFTVAQPDEFTEQEYQDYSTIASHLEQLRNTVRDLLSNAK